MNVKVSIVIPCYNVMAYIEDCLNSIFLQTYKNYEIVLVDDCSTDKTVSVIEQIIRRNSDKEILLLQHDRNKGVSETRNTGIRDAKGDYIFFVDSDDELTEQCLEKLVAPLTSKSYDVVIGCNYVIDIANNTQIVSGASTLQEVCKPMSELANGNIPIPVWNKLYRKDLIMEKDLFFIPGIIHEDLVWIYKLALSSENFFFIPDITYKYFIRKHSLMSSLSIEKDVLMYLDVFIYMQQIANDSFLNMHGAYNLWEIKKSGLLYSLLTLNMGELYKNTYMAMRIRYEQPSIKTLFKQKMIGLKEFVRDVHYCMPVKLGMFYKRMFYVVFYKVRGKAENIFRV